MIDFSKLRQKNILEDHLGAIEFAQVFHVSYRLVRLSPLDSFFLSVGEEVNWQERTKDEGLNGHCIAVAGRNV